MNLPGDAFTVPIDRLQPSQLYISAEKLAHVREAVASCSAASPAPLPVVRLGQDVVLTDGHTRVYAAWSAGQRSLRVTWDRDELDMGAYAICVSWCKEEGIRSIGDLQGRVVGTDAYQRLWLDRCAAMHRMLAAQRAGQ
jgi:hypothetical protein